MAGHDSVAMNTVAPSVMLFIPSVDGVSHCEREFSTDEDMVAGVDMLTGVARELVAGALADAYPEPAAALASRPSCTTSTPARPCGSSAPGSSRRWSSSKR